MKTYLLLILFTLNLIAQERVVTLSPSINEIVFALGEDDKIVGNTTYSDYPKESKKIKKIGGYFNLSLEKVLSVKPTLVVAQNYNKKLLSNLTALGINTKIYKTDSLDSIKQTIKSLGVYFKKEEKAKELIDELNENLSYLKNIVKNKKILIVIHPSKNLDKDIYVTGNFLYFEDIIQASNNINAYQSKSKAQPVINMEKLINLNPDIVILLGSFLENKPKLIKQVKNSWYNLPINASKKKNIYIIDKSYAGIPSNRVVYFIKDFRKILEDVKSK